MLLCVTPGFVSMVPESVGPQTLQDVDSCRSLTQRSSTTGRWKLGLPQESRCDGHRWPLMMGHNGDVMGHCS